MTARQVGYWRNSETLYRHAIAVTQENFAAYNNLGNSLFAEGKMEEALHCFGKRCAGSRITLTRIAAWRAAYAELSSRLKPAPISACLAIKPEAGADALLSGQPAARGRQDGGGGGTVPNAVDLKPDYSEAHYQLAVVLLARGEIAGASRHFREAVRLKPDWVEPLNNLAWLLATQPDARYRDGQEAVQLATRAVTLTHTNDPGALDTLAGALAEAGRFSEALKTAQTAARLAETSGAAQLRREIEAHLQCYRRGQPVREPSAPEPNVGQTPSAQ